MSPAVLVTGASGRLGRIVAPALGAAGWSVTTLGRRAGDATFDLDAVAETEPGALAARLPPADAIVHLAAIAHRAADPAAIERCNARATAVLAEAAHRAGIGRFVFASSIHAAEGGSGPYGAAKARGEAAVGSAYGRDHAALRLGPVLAAPAAGNLARLLALAVRAPASPFGALENRRRLVSPQTLVAGILAALEGRIAGVVDLVDRDPITIPALMRAFREGAGTRGVDLPAPPMLLRLVLGKRAAATLLAEDRADPAALLAAGVAIADHPAPAARALAASP
jgi:UDP-glucose 4-epimerase